MRRSLRLLPATVLTALVAATAVAAPASATTGTDSTGAVYTTDRVVVPMVFPVLGATSWSDSFLACRSGCARHHLGQDLMGAKMSPLVAAFDGTVTSLKRETAVGGGNYLVISADTGPAAGWSAVYIHVNDDTPGTDDGRGTTDWAFPKGIVVGAHVVAGQLVGWRGDSGDAETTGPHLHLELHKGWGWSGTVYNAFASLQAARHVASPVTSGPHPTGTVVRASGGTYLVDAGHKRPLSRTVLLADGWTERDVVSVSDGEVAGYANATAVRLRDGALVRSGSGPVQLVQAGRRSEVDPAALARGGQHVWPVTDADLAALPVAPLPTTPAAGGLVRFGSEPQVWQVGADRALHLLPSTVVLTSWGWPWSDVASVDPALRPTTVGAPLGLRDGSVVQVTAHQVVVVSQGTARRLWDARQLASYGYTGVRRAQVPPALLSGLRSAELTTS